MMSTKKYPIRLTRDEQQKLKEVVSLGRTTTSKQTHARILLMNDKSRPDGERRDADISGALGVGLSMVERVRPRCMKDYIQSTS